MGLGESTATRRILDIGKIRLVQGHTRNLEGMDEGSPTPVTVVRRSCFLVTSVKWISKKEDTWPGQPIHPHLGVHYLPTDINELKARAKEKNLPVTRRARREINMRLKYDSIQGATLHPHPYQDMSCNLRPSDVEWRSGITANKRI